MIEPETEDVTGAVAPPATTEEQFKNLYDYATEESYNALVIDATKGKPIFKKNFESILKIN